MCVTLFTLKKIYNERFTIYKKWGENAIKEIIRVTGDTAMLNNHVNSTLKQLRKAGYKVTKAKPATKKEVDNILSELNDL